MHTMHFHSVFHFIRWWFQWFFNLRQTVLPAYPEVNLRIVPLTTIISVFVSLQLPMELRLTVNLGTVFILISLLSSGEFSTLGKKASFSLIFILSTMLPNSATPSCLHLYVVCHVLGYSRDNQKTTRDRNFTTCFLCGEDDLIRCLSLYSVHLACL